MSHNLEDIEKKNRRMNFLSKFRNRGWKFWLALILIFASSGIVVYAATTFTIKSSGGITPATSQVILQSATISDGSSSNSASCTSSSDTFTCVLPSNANAGDTLTISVVFTNSGKLDGTVSTSTTCAQSDITPTDISNLNVPAGSTGTDGQITLSILSTSTDTVFSCTTSVTVS